MSQEASRTPLEILYSISRELANSLDLHTVLERVLALSISNIGAESASLVVLNDKGQPIDAALIFHGALAVTTIDQMHDVITSGLAGWVIRNKQAVLIKDTQQDERWLFRPNKEQITPSGKSALCVPVMARENLAGVLTIVHSSVGFFTKEHLALQQVIADMAGIAMDNAKLYEAVHSARERYYALFEESIDPIVITDLRGNIIEANHQATLVTGFSNNELISGTIHNLHKILSEKTGQHFEFIPAESSIAYESILHCKDSKQLPVEVHVSKISITGDKFAQWIFRDLQERKQLDQLREDLAAMIYHDLRSPLANIISSLEIMSSMLPLDQSAPLKSLFDIANRSTERMQRMISGLLDINRLEAGQQITEKQKSEIKKIVIDAVETIIPVATSKEITIEQVIEKNLPKVFVDADIIRRVFVNLLENAVKFSPIGSNIQIGAKKTSVHLLAWVDDQGPGIPIESRQRIFDKFVQLHHDQSIKGLGLGLAFCQLAVQAHGGTIWVENLPQGGSRFIFSLPLSTNE